MGRRSHWKKLEAKGLKDDPTWEQGKEGEPKKGRIDRGKNPHFSRLKFGTSQALNPVLFHAAHLE